MTKLDAISSHRSFSVGSPNKGSTAGGTQRLSRLIGIGIGRAKEIILCGRVLTAKEAVNVVIL